MYSLSVRHNVASIALRTVTWRSTIYLAPVDRLELDVELLRQLIEEDPRLTLPYLAGQLGYCHTAVEEHLNELGKTWRYGVWIPHELSPHQLQYRIDVCMDLMTYHRNYQSLCNLIIGDEKWVLYCILTRRTGANGYKR